MTQIANYAVFTISGPFMPRPGLAMDTINPDQTVAAASLAQYQADYPDHAFRLVALDDKCAIVEAD